LCYIFIYKSQNIAALAFIYFIVFSIILLFSIYFAFRKQL